MSGLQDLMAAIASRAFEEHGEMRVASAKWEGDGLQLEFEVNDGAGGTSRWEAAFGGVLESFLANVRECGLNVHRGRHPAIHQYTQPHEELHFSAAPSDPDQVIGRLWTAHRRVSDDWIQFDRFLNREVPLADLLASGSGVLATGPSFLIDAYAKVLEAHGCRPRRRTSKRRDQPKRALLAHFSESYVVAKTLAVRKIS